MDVQNIEVAKDYWHFRIDGGFLNELALISGRRRTSEPFWRPLELPLDALDELLQLLGDAQTLVDREGIEQCRPVPPLFPTSEIVTASVGNGFWIEISETMISDTQASTSLVLYSTRNRVQPALYLIDGEIARCHSDLLNFQTMLRDILEASGESIIDHPARPVEVVVRDATTPV